MNIVIVDDKLFSLGNVNYPRIYQAIPIDGKIVLQNIFERTQRLGEPLDWQAITVDGTAPTSQSEAVSMLNAVVYF